MRGAAGGVMAWVASLAVDSTAEGVSLADEVLERKSAESGDPLLLAVRFRTRRPDSTGEQEGEGRPDAVACDGGELNTGVREMEDIGVGMGDGAISRCVGSKRGVPGCA